MALLNLTAAARAAGVNRSTIARALKAGRLSATTNEVGERCIDTAELMRVFGSLAQGDAQAVPMHATADAQALVEVLQAQLHKAEERETRLLALLEAEQAARRELETRLLPAPIPPRPAPIRLWVLLALLAAAMAAWWWRDAILGAVAGW